MNNVDVGQNIWPADSELVAEQLYTMHQQFEQKGHFPCLTG
jgi:hypothetical protein